MAKRSGASGSETVTRTVETIDTASLEGGGALFVRVIESPDEAARDRRVALGARLTVGRTPSDQVDLVVVDPTISRRHATLVLASDGGLMLNDHESHNGTFVAGERGRTWRLDTPAIVRMGDTLFSIERGRSTLVDDASDDLLVPGGSLVMAALRAQLRRVAPSPLPVLLLGETGSGKEVAARAVHELSGRSGPFVALNAAAIPPQLVESHLFGHDEGAFTGAVRRRLGFFEAAAGGTLFFDEIAELPLELQPKLLRVLETLEFSRVGASEVTRADVRIVAATNADLAREVSAGTFRADLYARLAGAVFTLPPLRARRGDIPDLMRRFFAEADPAGVPKWTASFVEAMVLYDWPLNVRQLKTVVARLARLGEPILHAQHLRAVLGESIVTEESRAARSIPTRDELEALLKLHQGNVSRVARACGRHAKQLYRWFERHGLDPTAFRGEV
jgi:DNA-binding NtrC family response regulator